MQMAKRVFWIVLDSAGIGGAPDAADFGDAEADTFGSCYKSGGMNVPVMESIGLKNIKGTSFFDPKSDVKGCYCRMHEKSRGKDTTVGHWEMAGMVSPKPLPTYPNGFPQEILDKLSKATGREILCNLPYSGTDVIRDYGKQHVETGALIVYTSADSVLQIAAHEDVVPIEQLYEYCHMAREIMQGEHGVGRIIARPFEGEWPYKRTVRRHDYSLQPPRETVLDALKKEGYVNIGVGKIYDIFAGKSVMFSYSNKGNEANMVRTIDIADAAFEGLCYVNLVDTDMIYGHRRDIAGYTAALNTADRQLGELMDKMQPEDILIVTADHGCDPGYTGTDHTREDVPCLIWGPSLKQGVDLGTRDTFADMAATIADYFGIAYRGDGSSFLDQII
jgi:phosphopentomutase